MRQEPLRCPSCGDRAFSEGTCLRCNVAFVRDATSDPEDRSPVQFTAEDLVGRVASPPWLDALASGLGCLLWLPLVALCVLSMSVFVHRGGPLDTVETFGSLVGMFVAPIALYLAGGRALSSVSARLTDRLVRRLRRRIEASRRAEAAYEVTDDARAMRAGRVTFEGEAGEAMVFAPGAPSGTDVLAWQRSVRAMQPEVPGDLSVRLGQSHIVRSAGGDFWVHDAQGGRVLVRAAHVLIEWEGERIEVRAGFRVRVSGDATWRDADAGYRSAAGCWEIGGRPGDPVVITVVRSEVATPMGSGVRVVSETTESEEVEAAERNSHEAPATRAHRE